MGDVTTTRPWTRWWWMGNAVTREEITRHLTLYRDAGLGGVEITPIYGAKGYESQYIPLVSDQWMDMVRFAIREGERLGIGVDMTLGSGWPYGGPWVSPENATVKIDFIERDGRLEATLVPSKQQVSRAAPGGEGAVMCPFSRKAFAEFISPYALMMADGHVRPRCAFYDSFEVDTNSAREIFERFAEKKGYDLRQHTAALAGRGDPEIVSRVRCDYREVLGEMLLEEGAADWVKWCRQHGILSRYQAHGAPGNLLDLYAMADIPETEVFGAVAFPWQKPGSDLTIVTEKYPLVMKMASSAAHLAGRKLTACESFTWHREHFCGSFAQMRAETDQMFLAGINHIIFHGSTYSPAQAPWPGWAFYASTQFDPAQPLWRDLPAFNAYIAKCQQILQNAEVVSDFLLYLPYHDVMSRPGERLMVQLGVNTGTLKYITEMRWGDVALELWRDGYAFDWVSDRLLKSANTPAVVIPECQFMPLTTVSRLTEMAKAGTKVVFVGRVPQSEPGMAGLEKTQQYSAAVAELVAISVVTTLEELPAALAQAGVAPVTGDAPKGVRGLRLRRDGEEIYFIANHSAADFEGWLTLRDASRSDWTLVDFVTDQRGIAASDNGKVFVRLRQKESVFLMPAKPGERPWRCLRDAGECRPITGPWRLEAIAGGPTLPPAVELERPGSWTEISAAWREFAGTGRYSASVDFQPTSGRWLLSFGKIGESVRVALNGKELGVLWCEPFELDITDHLKPGQNQLVCEVTNLAINRVIAMDQRGETWKIFNNINFVNLHYKPFDASTWPPRGSGLIEFPVLKRATEIRPSR